VVVVVGMGVGVGEILETGFDSRCVLTTNFQYSFVVGNAAP
jgi:hypothetical protein